jgi:hypothetical protein
LILAKDLNTKLKLAYLNHYRDSRKHKSWRKTLPKEYHHFGGRPVAFGLVLDEDGELEFGVKFCTPEDLARTSSAREFYYRKEYAQKLLTRALFAQIAESFLRPLQKKFPKQVDVGIN